MTNQVRSTDAAQVVGDISREENSNVFNPPTPGTGLVEELDRYREIARIAFELPDVPYARQDFGDTFTPFFVLSLLNALTSKDEEISLHKAALTMADNRADSLYRRALSLEGQGEGLKRALEAHVELRKRYAEQLGEAIHTGLRKGVDGKGSERAWAAISSMDDGGWAEALAFARAGLEFGLEKRLAEAGAGLASLPKGDQGASTGEGGPPALMLAEYQRLSRAFNRTADLRDDQDRRINEWLQHMLAAKATFQAAVTRVSSPPQTSVSSGLMKCPQCAGTGKIHIVSGATTPAHDAPCPVCVGWPTPGATVRVATPGYVPAPPEHSDGSET